MQMDEKDRYLGCLMGLAVGDALGTALEFERPGTFKPIKDKVGGGPFVLKPGEWTDDTSMALCLAASLIECKGFDPADQMRRYLKWYREGYLSSSQRRGCSGKYALCNMGNRDIVDKVDMQTCIYQGGSWKRKAFRILLIRERR